MQATNAWLAALAQAELLLAQREAETDAREIRNSLRSELQTMESRFRAEVSELQMDRRRLVADHAQRSEDLGLQLQRTTTAEARARKHAMALRRAVFAQYSEAATSAEQLKDLLIAEPMLALRERDAHNRGVSLKL